MDRFRRSLAEAETPGLVIGCDDFQDVQFVVFIRTDINDLRRNSRGWSCYGSLLARGSSLRLLEPIVRGSR